ncbi:hypothetical protein GOBAR_AA23613 [Gossypium barbadense]|uniref:Uncharacterized protein n=1 Tax=Gossypium barbadense TaxID=3634 RepID=A0A2P5X124_GOSBA|nr:hypothetical protein GOBAR_AA23613 [Gossypium barbadense]
MALGVEFVEMGWDLSLRTQSRRALTMTSVWLQEEGEGEWGDNRVGRQILGHKGKLDPILDDVSIGEEGKKRGRGRLKICRLRKSLIPWR